MSNYDELIKKAQKEIEKLTAGIEKSKTRIAELRATIKEYEAKKAKDLQFSDTLLELMSLNGVTSDTDRKAVLEKMEEFLEALGAGNEEVKAEEQTETSAETEQEDEKPTTAGTAGSRQEALCLPVLPSSLTTSYFRHWSLMSFSDGTGHRSSSAPLPRC